ncbi:MAG TPA: hypothetical protein VGV86_12825 [Acidimicrobiales bacterium]|nr:hypothetical protein [Acidimicrobiales bacterium]
MPTPGSHGYDVQRTRLRGKLETEGVNDKNADELANRIMQRDNQATSPGLRSDRAAGPYGERSGGGDPGRPTALAGIQRPHDHAQPAQPGGRRPLTCPGLGSAAGGHRRAGLAL